MLQRLQTGHCHTLVPRSREQLAQACLLGPAGQRAPEETCFGVCVWGAPGLRARSRVNSLVFHFLCGDFFLNGRVSPKFSPAAGLSLGAFCTIYLRHFLRFPVFCFFSSLSLVCVFVTVSLKERSCYPASFLDLYCNSLVFSPLFLSFSDSILISFVEVSRSSSVCRLNYLESWGFTLTGGLCVWWESRRIWRK